MSRPRVNTNPPANRYSGKDERIIEFSGGKEGHGGLISLRVIDGELIVDLYRLDPSVIVRCPAANIAVQIEEDAADLPR